MTKQNFYKIFCGRSGFTATHVSYTIHDNALDDQKLRILKLIFY